MASDNKRKLYDALTAEYDMGDFETFALDVEDLGKRQKLYNVISKEYDLGDFDSFSKQLLGVNEVDNVRALYDPTYAPPVSTIEDSPYKEEEQQATYAAPPAFGGEVKVAGAEFISPYMAELKARKELTGNYFPATQAPTPTPKGSQPSVLNIRYNPEQATLEGTERVFDAIRAEKYKEIMSPYVSTYENEEKRQVLSKQYEDGTLGGSSAAGRTNAYKQLQQLNEEAKPWVEADNKEWTPESADEFRQQVIAETHRDPYAIVPESFKAQVAKQFGKEQSEEKYLAEWLNQKSAGRKAFLHGELVKSLLEPSKEDAERLAGIKERAEANSVGFMDRIKANYNAFGHLSNKVGTIPVAMSILQEGLDINKQTARALDKAEEIKQAYVNHNNDENFFLGVGKGIKDGLSDVDNWTGVYMLGDMGILTNLVGKINKGEKLTQEEEDYMDAQAYKLAVEAAMADELGWGYKSGNVTGVSIPFMLQMIASPVSSSTGMAVNKTLMGLGKRAVNKFGGTILKNLLAKTPKGITKILGSTAAQNIGKGLSRVAGATTAGAMQTAIFHADRTVADAMDRNLGNQAVVERTNEQYGTSLIPTFGEDMLTSTAKAVISGTSMNATEYLGGLLINPLITRYGKNLAQPLKETLAVFKPESVLRAAKATGAGKAIQAMENLGNYLKGSSKFVDRLAGSAEYDGLVSEYLEEVVDNVVNTAIGDMSVEDLLSPKKNAETILGLSWTSGAFNVMNKTARTTHYISLSRKMKKADLSLQEALKSKPEMLPKYEQFKQQLGQLRSFDEVGQAFGEFVDELSTQGSDATVAELIADATRYTSAYAGKMGHEAVIMTENKSDIASLVADSRENGYSMMDAYARKNIKSQLDKLSSIYGEAIEEKIAEAGGEVEFLRSIEGQVSDETFGTVLDYILLKEEYEGIKDARADELDAKVEVMNKRVDRSTHRESGLLIGAQMTDEQGNIITDPTTNEPKIFFVVSGDLTVDGGAVTPGVGTTIVRDLSGKYQMVDMSRLSGFMAEDANARKIYEAAVIASQERMRVEEEENLENPSVAPASAPSSTPVSPVSTSAPTATEGASAVPALEVVTEELARFGETGQEAMQFVDDLIERGESEEVINSQIETNFGSIAPRVKAYYMAKASALAEAVVEEAVAEGEEQAQEEEAQVQQEAYIVRTKDNDLDTKAMIAKGVPADRMASAFVNEFGEEDALTTAQAYLAMAQEERSKSKDPAVKGGSLKRKEQYWADVVRALAPQQEVAPETEAPQAETSVTETPQAEVPVEAQNANAKWQAAPKVYGRETTLRVKGMRLRGRYVVAPAGVATGSHTADFEDNADFIHDEQGRSRNPRDYSQASNQATTQEIAGNFALQNMQIVSPDGIVYDGNGRQIAGDIAAQNGTDGAYLEDLMDRADEFGFTPEQIQGMEHPRVYFEVAPGQLDYSAQTFDKFNAPEMKAPSAVELGAAMGQVLSDETFNRLADTIKQSGGLSAVYKSKPLQEAIAYILRDASDVKDVTTATLPQYYNADTRTLTEAGRNLLEACLLGKIFANNPEVLALLPKLPNKVMSKVAQAMPELAANMQMGEYALKDELANALTLVYEASQSGTSVNDYATQQDWTKGGSATDLFGKTVVMLAKALNGEIEGAELAEVVRAYNVKAVDVVTGQGSMFETPTREQMLQEVINYYMKGEVATQESAPQQEEAVPVIEESVPVTEEREHVTEESAPVSEESASQQEEATSSSNSSISEKVETARGMLKEYNKAHAEWVDAVDNAKGMEAATESYLQKQKDFKAFLMTLSEEELEAVSSIDSTAEAEVKKEERRRHRQAELAEDYENALSSQGEITPVAPKFKGSIFDATVKDETRPVFGGVYHKDGTAVATDGRILIEEKGAYEQEKEGKLVDKKGNVMEGQRFPNWKGVIPKDVEAFGISMESLRSFVEGVRQDAKKKGKKEADVTVVVKLPNGNFAYFELPHLVKFTNAAYRLGATELMLSAREDAPLLVQTDKGTAMLMPLLRAPEEIYAYEISGKETEKTAPAEQKAESVSHEELVEQNKQKLSSYANRDLNALIKKIKDAMPHLQARVERTEEGSEERQNAEVELKKWSAVLEAAETLLAERKNGSWKNQFAVPLSESKELSVEEVKALFESLNGDKAVGELFGKVYAVAKTLGLKIKISDQLSKAQGNAGNDGIVKYAASLFYLPYPDQERASTLLHELIHACTMYATGLHANRNNSRGLTSRYDGLPQQIKDACAELEEIYNNIKNDKRVAGEYGIKSVDEMVAELSNPVFREKMKEISLWGKIVGAIKRLFGFEALAPEGSEVSNALAEAERVLVNMLDNFDKSTYDAIRDKLQRSGRGRRNTIIGKKGAIHLDAIEGVTNRMDNKDVAEEMEAAGKDAETIWLATGWERGTEGKWRYEVLEDFAYEEPRAKAERLQEEYQQVQNEKENVYRYLNRFPARGLTEQQKAIKKEQNARLKKLIKKSEQLQDEIIESRSDTTLGELIGTDNNIIKAYPELASMPVSFVENSRFMDAGLNGAFDGEGIWINPTLENTAPTLLHEVQHAIQRIEGFARGGNTGSVKTKADALREDVRPLHEMMLGTPEWAERKRLQNRWFDETDEAEIAKIEQRVTEINESGALDAIQSKRKQLQEKYGSDATVGKILSSPYAEDAEIWQQLPESFNDKYEAYRNLAGEAEARNVSARLNMSEEERRQTRPGKTEDVAREEQTVREDESGKDESGKNEGAIQSNKKGNPQHDQSASSLKKRQDLTTGYSISHTTDLGTKVSISCEEAKNNLLNLARKYEGKRTTRGFLTDVAKSLGDNSLPQQSRYFDIVTQKGDTYTLRLSNHNVNAENAPSDKIEFSIVIKSRRRSNNFIAGEAEIREYVYFKEDIASGDKRILASIIESISSLLDTGVYVDKSGIAVENVSPADVYRQGDGRYTDEELALINDPAARLYGESFRTKKQQKQYAERVRNHMRKKANELAEKLHLPVEIIESEEDMAKLQGKKAKAKGWYEVKSGKIVLVLPNNGSVADIVETVLHEGVAHLGLRKLFGKQFTQFLDNVYNHAEQSIREKIDGIARKGKVSTRTATEEYLASLAETTDFENINAKWWSQIKKFFLDMLHTIGFDYKGGTISDSELRYILWRSHENLKDPNSHLNVFSQAKDIAMQNRLKAEEKQAKERKRILSLGKTDSNLFAADRVNEEELAYNLKNGIRISPQEYAQVSAIIQTYPNKSERGHVFTANNYYLCTDIDEEGNFKVVAAMSIEGNEELINEIRGENKYIAFKPLSRTESTAGVISRLQRQGKRLGRNLSAVEGQTGADGRNDSVHLGQQANTGADQRSSDRNDGAVEEETLYRMGDANDPNETAQRIYNEEMLSARFLAKETMVDYLASLESLQRIIAEKGGKITSFQDAYSRMLALSSRNKQEIDLFDYSIMPQLTKAIGEILGRTGKINWESPAAKTLQRYTKVKHGIERDRDMAVKKALPAIADMKFKEQFAEINQRIEESTLRSEYEELIKERADMRANPAKYGLLSAEQIEGSLEAEWYKRTGKIRAEKGTWKEKQQRMDKAIAEVFGLDQVGLKAFGLELTEDYSGITETLVNEGRLTRKEVRKDRYAARKKAYEFVEQYEEQIGQDKADGLWNAIKAVSGFALEKQRQCGLVSAKYVADCNKRFEFYVPLRGFNEDVAHDVYDYLDDVYNNNNPVQTAKGRESEAGNPFANLMNIGYRSITAGNHNLAVQAFWNLANRKDVKGFLVPSRVWHLAKLTPKQQDFVREKLRGIADLSNDDILPYLPEDASAEEIQDLLDDFEETMKGLKAMGYAYQGSRKARQELRTLSKTEENAHRVKVYIDGEVRYVTVVGNPRAAQALNGQLNPEQADWAALKGLQNFLAGAFTSQNPSFALANLVRDTQHANMRAFITENPKYWGTLSWKQAQFWKYGVVNIMKMLAAYENSIGNTGRHGWGGTLDPTDKMHMRFKRFMEQGGATGFTFSRKQHENLEKLAKMAENVEGKSTPGQGFVVGEFFDIIRTFTEASELVNRFAAYETSLEMGRTEQQAIRDAKEITLNFNRKGAGRATYNANRASGNKTYTNLKYSAVNGLANLSQFGRDNLIFWNASVQGAYQLWSMLKKHPIKTFIAYGAVPYTVAAFVLPALNALLCGDDDKYYDELPEYERQRNICIKIPGTKGWFKIPLDPATQKIWAMGEATGAFIYGKKEFNLWNDIGANFVGLFSPVDIYWGDKNQNIVQRALSVGSSFTPTLAQPLLHTFANRDWKGKPLENDSRYLDHLPSYKKAFKSDKTSLTELSKWMNEWANEDADTYKVGPLDFASPGVMEELLFGYTGGYGQAALAAVEAAWSLVSDEAKGKFQLDKQPIFNRFWVEGNPGQTKRTIFMNYNREVGDFMEEVEQRRSAINRDIKNAAIRQDDTDYGKAVDAREKFFNSTDWKKYVKLKAADAQVRQEAKGGIENASDITTSAMLEAIEMIHDDKAFEANEQ